MAPNAHLFIRPDWRRWVTPGSELYSVYELYESKYRPDQLRDDHGRFAYEGGQGKDHEASTEAIFAKAKRIAARGGITYQQCLDLCYPLLERFIRPGSDKNTFDFHKCMNACMGK